MSTPPSRGLVSVILVNRNCGALADLVFPTLLRQTYRRIDILVVDNGSDDGSSDRIRRSYPQVRVLGLGRNTGFSHALNEGIRQSDGEYVLSLNFDVILEAGFVEALVTALDQRPDAGWAAGAMRRLTAAGDVREDEIDCNGHYLLRSRYCYGYDPDRASPGSYGEPCEVFGASACAALYRRSLLESLALEGEIFDEDLFAYFEDVDLDWRAQRQGSRCLFVPAARGAHMRGGTNLPAQPAIAALLPANRFLVMMKHDRVRDIAADAWPILLRTGVDLVILLRTHPTAIAIAAARLLRLAPRMLAKRRALRRRDVAGSSPVQRFRLATRSLG